MRHRLHPSEKHTFYRADGKFGGKKGVYTSHQCGELALKAKADFFAFGRLTKDGDASLLREATECLIYFSKDIYQEAGFEEWGLTFFLNIKYVKQAKRFRPGMEEEEYEPVDRFGRKLSDDEIEAYGHKGEAMLDAKYADVKITDAEVNSVPKGEFETEFEVMTDFTEDY